MGSKQQFLSNLNIIKEDIEKLNIFKENIEKLKQDIEKLNEEEFRLIFKKPGKKATYKDIISDIDINKFDEIKNEIEKAPSRGHALELLENEEILNNKNRLINFAKHYSIAINKKDKKEEIINRILRRLYEAKKQREVISNLDL